MTDWPLPGWTVHEVRQDISLHVTRDMPALCAPLNQEIDRIWHRAQNRLGGKLFNGRVFSADEISAHQLRGHWTEYRRIVAQMEFPGLFAELALRPTATGGLLSCADGIVFGRRPKRAIYQAAQWQLAPAGSIDPSAVRSNGSIDIMAQIQTELTEELGLLSDAIQRSSLLCLVEHPDSHVLDLGVALWTSLDETAVRRAHASNGNGEYSELMVVPPAAVARVVDELSDGLAPQAHAFLRQAGLLGHAVVTSPSNSAPGVPNVRS